MIDYVESKIARQEHEQRVRSLTPVREHAAWLKDDRQLSLWPIRAGIVAASPERRGWLSKQVRRLLSLVSPSSVNKRRERDIVLEVSLEDRHI